MARNSAPGAAPLVERGEVLVLVDADAPHAVGGGLDDAAGAGLAAGAEDDVGALADEPAGVGRALGGVVEGLVVDGSTRMSGLTDLAPAS